MCSISGFRFLASWLPSAVRARRATQPNPIPSDLTVRTVLKYPSMFQIEMRDRTVAARSVHPCES